VHPTNSNTHHQKWQGKKTADQSNREYHLNILETLTDLIFRPYGGRQAVLHFDAEKELRMPFDILEPYVELTRKRKRDETEITGGSSGEIFDLTEIPFDAGHVIVHYLMTGTYQCLRARHPEEEWRCAKEFRTAICVYVATLEKKLPELRYLARQQIAKLGERISLLTVITTIEEIRLAPKSLSGTFHDGISGYLQFKIQSFVQNATEAEGKDMLAKLETPRTLSNILLKNMVLMKLTTKPKKEEKTGQKMGNAPAAKTSVQLAEEAIQEAEVAHQRAHEEELCRRIREFSQRVKARRGTKGVDQG